MKAQWSGMTAPVTDPEAGDRWDTFLEDVCVCPQCGALSVLHRECLSCGTEMTPVWQGSFRAATGREGGLRVLSYLLLIGAFTALGLCGFGLWGAVVMILLAVIVVLAEIAVFRGRFRGKEGERNLHVMSMESAWLSGKKNRDMADGFRSLERTRDAYYADLLWLDEQLEQLQEGDSEGRDRLFAHALHLSRICDCGRLARIRLRLLCRADLSEGVYSDIDQITGMLLADEQGLLCLLEEPRGVRTLCDCIRLDPVGTMSKSAVTACVRLLTDGGLYRDRLTDEENRMLCKALAFCGPFALDADSAQVRRLLDSPAYDALCRMEPGFWSLQCGGKLDPDDR